MKKVFLITAAAILTGTVSMTIANAQPPVDDQRMQVAQDEKIQPTKAGSEHRDEISDKVRQELKEYHEKKKALREALSPEAKEALKKRFMRKEKHERRGKVERKEEIYDDNHDRKVRTKNKNEDQQ